MILLKKDEYNSKLKNIDDKIPSITNLATTTALTAVEIRILNVSSLVKKTDQNTKISVTGNQITVNHNHSNKYIATQEFNNLTS